MCVTMHNESSGAVSTWCDNEFMDIMFIMQDMYEKFMNDDKDWDRPKVIIVEFICVARASITLLSGLSHPCNRNVNICNY